MGGLINMTRMMVLQIMREYASHYNIKEYGSMSKYDLVFPEFQYKSRVCNIF